MGEKPFELDHQVCIVAQVDADDCNPDALQAADVRVTERQVVALCAFVDRVAVVKHHDEFPALRAVLQGGFGQLQTPVQEFVVRSASEPSHQRLDGLERAHRQGSCFQDAFTIGIRVRPEKGQAGRNFELHRGQVQAHQRQAHLGVAVAHGAGAIHHQVESQVTRVFGDGLRQQVRRFRGAGLLAEAVTPLE